MKTLLGALCVATQLTLPLAASAQQDAWDDATEAYETQHFARALALYEQLAMTGHAQAAEIAGAMLFYGEPLYGAEVRQDRARAMVLLQRVPAIDHPGAAYLLRRIAVITAKDGAKGHPVVRAP
jgi:TPR repeat protein